MIEKESRRQQMKGTNRYIFDGEKNIDILQELYVIKSVIQKIMGNYKPNVVAEVEKEEVKSYASTAALEIVNTSLKQVVDELNRLKGLVNNLNNYVTKEEFNTAISNIPNGNVTTQDLLKVKDLIRRTNVNLSKEVLERKTADSALGLTTTNLSTFEGLYVTVFQEYITYINNYIEEISNTTFSVSDKAFSFINNKMVSYNAQDYYNTSEFSHDDMKVKSYSGGLNTFTSEKSIEDIKQILDPNNEYYFDSFGVFTEKKLFWAFFNNSIKVVLYDTEFDTYVNIPIDDILAFLPTNSYIGAIEVIGSNFESGLIKVSFVDHSKFSSAILEIDSYGIILGLHCITNNISTAVKKDGKIYVFSHQKDILIYENQVLIETVLFGSSNYIDTAKLFFPKLKLINFHKNNGKIQEAYATASALNIVNFNSSPNVLGFYEISSYDLGPAIDSDLDKIVDVSSEESEYIYVSIYFFPDLLVTGVAVGYS